MRGDRPHSTHEESGDTPLREGSRSRHSGSFGSFEGVGSADTQPGSPGDEWADANASLLPSGISSVSSPHVAPNIGPKGASFPLPFLASALQAMTLALPTFTISSNPGIGVVSDRGDDDTSEAKTAASGSFSSSCLRLTCIKPGTSASGLAPSLSNSAFPSPLLGSAFSPRGPV